MNLIDKINLFYKLAMQDSETLKKLSNMETFKEKIDYAEEHLNHFSSGSSRIVYLLPGEKEVLKLAKNEKGEAQNKSEAKVQGKYLNHANLSCKKGTWIIAPFLQKITEKEFEQLCGYNFKDFTQSIRYEIKKGSSDSIDKPKAFKEVEKSDFFKEFLASVKKYDLTSGDIARISSWGKSDGHPILLDSGLTRKIFDDYYES